MRRLLAVSLFLTLMLGACAQPQAPSVPSPSAAPVETVAPTQTAAPAPVVPDENGMLTLRDSWAEAGDEVDEASVLRFAEKLRDLRRDYLSGAQCVCYAVIPDKSYLARAETDAYLDHEAIVRTLDAELSDWDSVDLTPLLTLDDYYRTDPHWRQERLFPVVDALGEALSFTVDARSFTEQARDDFVGSYRQWMDGLPEERICWLTSAATEAATVEDTEHPDFTAVYDLSRLDTEMGYDLFLSSATPLTVLTNPNAAQTRELVLFRDSFGSSLAPLLLDAYSKITLVDLRYMVSSLLPRYVDFDGADVLFLYSDRLVNTSLLLR